MRGVSFSVLIVSLLSGSATFASAANMSGLAPHRAVYDLELKDASDRSGIQGLTGRMVYDFTGSACEGFTSTFRYVTKINDGENNRVTDQQTTTFESADGKEFRFLTKSFVDQKLDTETRGSAMDKDGGVAVEVTKPAEARHKLDASFFPTTHMIDMLTRAEKGEKFYEASIFDGTEDADRTLTTTVIIGDKNKSASDGEDKAIGETIPGKDYFPVSVSYFDPKSEKGEEEPIYQVGFKLYANGITRDLIM
ncbi:MAG: EipB family protein, partial [Rhizobiaceae bacterium]